MHTRNKWIAFFAVLVFCLTAVVPAALAAETRAQLTIPTGVDAKMGAPVTILLPWKAGFEPEEGVNTDDWTVRTVKTDGPEITWGKVTKDGATGEAMMPGTPGGRATYTYTVELLAGEQKIGQEISFTFDAFAPQILPVAGVQKVTGETADVQIKWNAEEAPAEGTVYSAWKIVSSSDGAPEITWGELGPEGATGQLSVPADAPDGTTYEYSVEIQQDGQRVGNPTTMTAIVQRHDAVLAAPEGMKAVPGETLSIALPWQDAQNPAGGADLAALRATSQCEADGPEIAWDEVNAEGVKGTVTIPQDAIGQKYVYRIAVLQGDAQVGSGATLTIDVWGPQLRNVTTGVLAGGTLDITVGWAEDQQIPEGVSLEGCTVKAESETGTEAAWTLREDGAAAHISIPENAKPGSSIVYTLTIMQGERAVSDPATLTLELLGPQLAEPQPLAAPPDKETEFQLTWQEGRKPEEGQDFTGWSVHYETKNGPEISWGAVDAAGVHGTVHMKANAIAGVEYAYTITLQDAEQKQVGSEVTLFVVVGDAIASPITVEPSNVAITPGAPAITVTAMQDGEVAKDGWWSLEVGSPEGATIETLGVTNTETNPIEIKTEANAPIGTYTLVYNKDTVSGMIVVVIHIASDEALITPKPDSGIVVKYSEEHEAFLITGVPISATQVMYTPGIFEEAFDVPVGFELRLVDGDGEVVPEEDAVATGDVLDVLQGGEVAERMYVVVRGDVMGNGLISLTQLVRMAQAYTGKNPLEGLFAIAGDLTGTGSLSLTDLIQEAQLLLQFS